jgi:monovalent cation:H+ antiporter, CPA1 family
MPVHPAAVESSGLSIPMVIILISIAAFIAALVKRVNIPYTIALVLGGLVLSLFHVLEPVELTEELVLFTFLPALLFEASWNLDVRHLKAQVTPVLMMATIGVVLSIAIIGYAMHFIVGIPLLPALLLGAMLAPTDPVSVVAIMKQFRLDHRLASTIEAESLCNDGTAVVLYKLLAALLIVGVGAFTADPLSFGLGALGQFVAVVGGGALLGALLGGAFSFFTSRFNDHLLELTFTTIVAYGSFFLAEQIIVPGQIPSLHLSGVLSTVAAGLVMGNVGRQYGMSASTSIVVSSFWEYAAFFVNSMIFLLVGLKIGVIHMIESWPLISIGFGVVLLARAVSVYGLSAVSRLFGVKLPAAWQHVLVWSGLRGALSMALVLSMPKGLVPPDIKETLTVIVFGVVLGSLLLQGLTMPKLLKWLGLAHVISPELAEYQGKKAVLVAEQHVLKQIDTLFKEGKISHVAAEEMRESAEHRIAEVRAEIDALRLSKSSLVEEETREAHRQLNVLRKATIADLVKEGLLSEDMGEDLRASYDYELEDADETAPNRTKPA